MPDKIQPRSIVTEDCDSRWRGYLALTPAGDVRLSLRATLSLFAPHLHPANAA